MIGQVGQVPCQRPPWNPQGAGYLLPPDRPAAAYLGRILAVLGPGFPPQPQKNPDRASHAGDVLRA